MMRFLNHALFTLVFCTATAANAMFWTTDKIVVQREDEGFVSQYRTGTTDTFGVFEELLLVDCKNAVYQGYLVVHYDVFNADASLEFTIKEDAEIDVFIVHLKQLRILDGFISFDALEALSKEIGANEQFKDDTYFLGGERLTEVCMQMNYGSGGWKIK